MLTHGNLISNAVSSAKAIKITSRDNFVCVLPLFHSFAATVCMLLPLLNGGRMTIFASPRPFKRVLRTMIKKKVTIFTGIPSIFNILKDAKVPRLLTTPLISKIINPLRMCISGAAALPVDTLVRFEKKFKIPLIEGYGLTEASPVVSLNPLKGVRKPGSIGLPLPDVKIKVIDDKDKQLSTGQIGELLVMGPNVMRGYLNQPEANKETIKDGWLYTGDLVKTDSDGYIFIVGRKKEMVNVRGFNVYPKEIEDVLYQHPLVKEAAVIGVTDQHKGEVPKGFVVLKENSGSPDAQPPRSPDEIERELLHYLRERLAAYKIPRKIEVVESFPKSATGKILKRLLQ
jgi:long-chain acyl-CoA synthetase